MTALGPTPLVLAAPGDRVLSGVLRKLRLLAARNLLTLPARAVPGDVAVRLPGLQAGLAAALRRSPDAVLAAVGDPDVLPRLLMLAGGPGAPEAHLRAAVPALLGAIDGVAVPEPLVWDLPIAALPTPSAGRLVRFDPPARGVALDASGLDVALADGRRARLRDGLPEGASSEAPYHDLGPALGGAHLCEHDTNPLAMMEDHPDKAGNAVDLGGRPVGAWVAALQEAGALIAAGLPAQSAELGVALRRVIPVGFEPERHLSASYREAPGLIYLTLHPSALTLAEAIVHEVQHGKLNALSWLDPVLRNGRTTWTRSPVRPDERPLMGVLLAAHAFVPVAALHAGLATARHPIAGTAAFSLRRSEVLRANAAALDTLHQHADPTAAGGRLLADLQANHAALLDLAA